MKFLSEFAYTGLNPSRSLVRFADRYHKADLLSNSPMATGSPPPTWAEVRRRVLLVESTRILRETVSQCIDRLEQAEREFREELNNDSDALLKCSLWTQGHLEYTDARVSGTAGDVLLSDPAHVTTVEQLVSVLQAAIELTNAALSVSVQTQTEQPDKITVDECRQRLKQAIGIAHKTRESLDKLRSQCDTAHDEAAYAWDNLTSSYRVAS